MACYASAFYSSIYCMTTQQCNCLFIGIVSLNCIPHAGPCRLACGVPLMISWYRNITTCHMGLWSSVTHLFFQLLWESDNEVTSKTQRSINLRRFHFQNLFCMAHNCKVKPFCFVNIKKRECYSIYHLLYSFLSIPYIFTKKIFLYCQNFKIVTVTTITVMPTGAESYGRCVIWL